MIGLLILARELVRGAHPPRVTTPRPKTALSGDRSTSFRAKEVRDRETQSPTPETGVLPGRAARQHTDGESLMANSLNP